MQLLATPLQNESNTMANSSLSQVKCITCGAWGPQNAFNKRAGQCLVCYQHMLSNMHEIPLESNTMLNEAEIKKLFDKEIADAEREIQADITIQINIIRKAESKITMLSSRETILVNKLKRIQGSITKTPKE